ncbi:MAG: ABC transporter substrate-binding protein [Chloroflexota bacterium]|nr:MAG: ABC transporter substrate-binding protein [Chloroflexota bacterium]
MSTRLRWLGLWMVMLLLSLAVTQCTSASAPATSGAPSKSIAPAPAASTAPSPAASSPAASPKPLSMQKVSVAGIALGQQTPIWIAQEKGFFKQEGLEVQFVNTPTGREIMSALIGGSVQFGVPSITDPLNAIEQGAQLRTVFTLTTAGELALVIRKDVAAKLGITADMPADTALRRVKGIKIGISSIGTGAHLQTSAVLKQRGVNTDTDVSFVPVGGGPALLAAYQQKAIDAFAWVPPEDLMAEHAGDTLVFWFNQLDEYKGLTYMTLTVTKQFIDEHTDVVQAFVRGAAQGWKYLMTDKEGAYQVFKTHVPYPDEWLQKATFDTVYPNFQNGFWFSRAGFDKGVALANFGRKEPLKVTYEQFVDERFVNQAMQDLKIPRP